MQNLIRIQKDKAKYLKFNYMINDKYLRNLYKIELI